MAVISHDRLMFTLRANEGRDTIDGQARTILSEELRRLVVEDLKLRDAAYASGVRDISKLCTPPANKTDVINIAATTYDDKRICIACQHTCFLSAVGCECSKKDIVCLRHVAYSCQCPNSMKYMIEWESRDALEALLKELDAELGPLPKKRGRDLPIPGGAQVAEDRGLDPPPSLEEQARMASALATPRPPARRPARSRSLPPQSMVHAASGGVFVVYLYITYWVTGMTTEPHSGPSARIARNNKNSSRQTKRGQT